MFTLALTRQEWLILFPNPNLKKLNPESFHGNNFKERHNKRNKEIDDFLLALKKLKDEQAPSRTEEPIELLSKESLIYDDIIQHLQSEQYDHMVSSILKREGRDYYYPEIQKFQNLFFSGDKEYVYFNIAKSAFLTGKRYDIQKTFENLKEQYNKVTKRSELIDIRAAFHKSLRTADLLGNGHGEWILWNLIQISAIPFFIIEEVILKKTASELEELQ